MTIREYKSEDKEKCIRIFQSNHPKFFDTEELNLFIKWLEHQGDAGLAYKSPTYSNSEKDAYYVVEDAGRGIVGCGGFYIATNTREARLAWGMIDSKYHKKGYGTALYKYREQKIREEWPGYTMVLGTSQHTYNFYRKMGMTVKSITKAGYGPDLDKYDMSQ